MFNARSDRGRGERALAVVHGRILIGSVLIVSVAIGLVAIVSVAVSPAGAQSPTVSEADLGWSATAPLMSKEAGRTTVHPDRNPVVGTWVVDEVRFNGEIVPPPPPSKDRTAGFTIRETDWSDIFGFDGCNELNGKFNLFSGTLVVEAYTRPLDGTSLASIGEPCASLRYPGVIRRALSSSPKVNVGVDQWTIDVQGMFVRFRRSSESMVNTGTDAFLVALARTTWQVTNIMIEGVATVPSRPVLLIDPFSMGWFDGCRLVPQLRRSNVRWIGANTASWQFHELLPEDVERRNDWQPTSGCPTGSASFSAGVQRIVTNDFVLVRNGATATVRGAAGEIHLLELAPNRLGSAFAVPFDRPGTWTFVSLSVSGRVVAGSNRLDVAPPIGVGAPFSDGCNNYRSSVIEFDGRLYGSVGQLTRLPCRDENSFASTFRSLMTTGVISHETNRISVSDGSVRATFAFASWPQPDEPFSAKGPELSGSWTLAKLTVGGRAIPTMNKPKSAGLVSVTFRAGHRADYFDGCNSTEDAVYEIVDGRLRFEQGRQTLVYCAGSDSDNAAVVVRSAVAGRMTSGPKVLVFQRGDAVVTFRRK